MGKESTAHISPKQGLAYKYLIDKNTEYLAFGGGANGGKSWLGNLWVILMCLQYPGVKLFIGRNQLSDIYDSTYITFMKVCKMLGVLQSQWSIDRQRNYITFDNGSRIDFLSLQYLPRDPMFERFGSKEYTCGFIEEGGEINFAAFDVLKSRIGRHLNDKYNVLGKMLITCNPKRNWLYTYFYKPLKNKTLLPNYKFIQSLVGDNIYREKGSIEKLKQITDKATRQRLLYGNWDYEDDPRQTIKYEWVKRAEDRDYSIAGKNVLGADIARYGDDSTTLAGMSGSALEYIKSYQHKDTFETSDIIEKEIKGKPYDADCVGIDGVGLGAGVVDNLKHRGLITVDIISGARADERLASSEYEFYNLRSQMWWLAREDFMNDNLTINVEDDELAEDLTAPYYEIVNDKQIKIESKKDTKARIGRSPDKGDAFVYANYIRRLRIVFGEFSLFNYEKVKELLELVSKPKKILIEGTTLTFYKEGNINYWCRGFSDMHNRYVIFCNPSEKTVILVYDRVDMSICLSMENNYDMSKNAFVINVISEAYDKPKIAIGFLKDNKHLSKTLVETLHEKYKNCSLFYHNIIKTDSITLNKSYGYFEKDDYTAERINRFLNDEDERILVNDESIVSQMLKMESLDNEKNYVIAFGGVLVVSDQMPIPVRVDRYDMDYDEMITGDAVDAFS